MKANKKIINITIFLLIILTIVSIPTFLKTSSPDYAFYNDDTIEYEHVDEIELTEADVGKIYRVGTYITNVSSGPFYICYKTEDIGDKCQEAKDGYRSLGYVTDSYGNTNFSVHTMYWKLTSINGSIAEFNAVDYNKPITGANQLIRGIILRNNTFMGISGVDLVYKTENGTEICTNSLVYEPSYHILRSYNYIGYCDVSEEPKEKSECWIVDNYTNSNTTGVNDTVELVAHDCVPESDQTESTIVIIWDDDDDRDGLRPQNMTFSLNNDLDTSFSTKVEPQQTHTYNYLPKYDNNSEIDYSWFMVSGIPIGYELVRNTKEGTVTTFEFKHEIETISITGNKIWDDANNQDGLRPVSINLQLRGSDGSTRTLEISNNNNPDWSFIFENLPKNSYGNPITYTLTETAITGYNTPVITKISEENDVITYQITNKHVTKKKNVKVIKDWDDANNQDGLRPDEITITLLEDDNPYLDITGSPIVVALTESNNWEYTFTDLPKYRAGNAINYSVAEVAIDHYSIPEISIVSDTDDLITYKITNKHTVSTKNVEIKMLWEDNDNEDQTRPEEVIVTLLADGEPILDSEGNPLTAKLTPDNDWSYTFQDMPIFKNGNLIEYAVLSATIDKYHEPELTILSATEDITSIQLKNVYVNATSNPTEPDPQPEPTPTEPEKPKEEPKETEDNVENPITSTGLTAIILFIISGIILFINRKRIFMR